MLMCIVFKTIHLHINYTFTYLKLYISCILGWGSYFWAIVGHVSVSMAFFAVQVIFWTVTVQTANQVLLQLMCWHVIGLLLRLVFSVLYKTVSCGLSFSIVCDQDYELLSMFGVTMCRVTMHTRGSRRSATVAIPTCSFRKASKWLGLNRQKHRTWWMTDWSRVCNERFKCLASMCASLVSSFHFISIFCPLLSSVVEVHAFLLCYFRVSSHLPNFLLNIL